MAVLTSAAGAPHARILSVGSCRGERVVDNAEMCTMIDSSDEWIQQRTGIVERRWASQDQTVVGMAADASRVAVERAGLSLDQVDAIIVATISGTRSMPSVACEVAAELGIQGAAAFDVTAACAGFCKGLSLADSLVRTGGATHVLVVGVEILSRLLDTSDRGTAFLFGDGAGACVVGPSEVPAMSPVVWGSDASQADVLTIDDSRSLAEGQPHPYIRMEGTKVFRWATTFISDRAREVLEASGLAPEELDVFIPHQANNRITDSILRHLKLPEDVVVARDIRNSGNTSAASIPLAMDELLSSGKATSGQQALLIGFGGGLAYAGQVVTLP